MHRRRFLLSSAALAVAGSTTAAKAHAHLRQAEPAAGSTVTELPSRVLLRFSEAIEPAFSRIRVSNAAGRQIDLRDTGLAEDDAQAIAVSLPRLAPGDYAVAWTVVSVDSHRTEGRYTFTVVGG